MVEKMLVRFPLLKKILKIVLHINIKTIYFNFTYFSFKEAIQFPVFVKSKTKLLKTKGRIILNDKIYPGMISIGFGHVGQYDRKYLRCIWEVKGDVIFKGEALFKYGSKVVVAEGAILDIGDKFRLSPNSSVVCYKEMIFGESCRISWDVLIMDTDFHKVWSLDGKQLNHPKPIIIGNHVWIGTRCTILKGTRIYDDCIIASNSVVTKDIPGEHQLIVGNPARVVKTGVTWGA